MPGVCGVGLERDPDLAALAGVNFAANGFTGLSAVAVSVEAYAAEASFDHAMANPPWHAPEGTASPDAGREAARRADPALLARWVACLTASLRHRGTLTLIAAAATVPAWIAALPGAGCGSPAILPLWPRAGQPAKLVLLRVVRGGRAPLRLLPGLVLHADDGAFTAAAQAVLRDGATLPI